MQQNACHHSPPHLNTSIKSISESQFQSNRNFRRNEQKVYELFTCLVHQCWRPRSYIRTSPIFRVRVGVDERNSNGHGFSSITRNIAFVAMQLDRMGVRLPLLVSLHSYRVLGVVGSWFSPILPTPYRRAGCTEVGWPLTARSISVIAPPGQNMYGLFDSVARYSFCEQAEWSYGVLCCTRMSNGATGICLWHLYRTHAATTRLYSGPVDHCYRQDIMFVITHRIGSQSLTRVRL